MGGSKFWLLLFRNFHNPRILWGKVTFAKITVFILLIHLPDTYKRKVMGNPWFDNNNLNFMIKFENVTICFEIKLAYESDEEM